MTEKAFQNALAVDMALGCSTNTVLHLAAIAAEAGVAIDLDMINAVSGKTPHLCSLSPGGKDHIEDLNRAGGIHAVHEGAGGTRPDPPATASPSPARPWARTSKAPRSWTPTSSGPSATPTMPAGRPGGPLRQSGARRLRGQAIGGPRGDDAPRRAGPGLRLRGGGLRGHHGREDPKGGRGRHPLRGPQGRARACGKC